jgi:hypothetical protein
MTVGRNLSGKRQGQARRLTQEVFVRQRRESRGQSMESRRARAMEAQRASWTKSWESERRISTQTAFGEIDVKPERCSPGWNEPKTGSAVGSWRHGTWGQQCWASWRSTREKGKTEDQGQLEANNYKPSLTANTKFLCKIAFLVSFVLITNQQLILSHTPLDDARNRVGNAGRDCLCTDTDAEPGPS